MSSERNQLRTKFQQQTKIIEPILRLKIPMIAKKRCKPLHDKTHKKTANGWRAMRLTSNQLMSSW
jgi:hypothetical protein